MKEAEIMEHYKQGYKRGFVEGYNKPKVNYILLFTGVISCLTIIGFFGVFL